MTTRNGVTLRFCVALVLAFAATLGGAGNRAPSNSRDLLAATPPMGWNSWDGFGATIGETEFRATADWLAKHLEPFGWQYVVVDAEWYVANPVAEGNSKTFQFTMDGYGRYTPPVSRFPSAANDGGFKALADYAHSLGLKFGIHILRGIPKEAVAKNLPIAGSAYHAAEAADTSDTCPWNYDNYGIDASKPAGQAYYDSIVQLYASWGVDFIKVDCISSHPYKGDEIGMLSAGLGKTDRPIVLSVSPGPAPVEKAEELRKYAQTWRISNDIWDLWHGDTDYPQGVGDQFSNAAKWASFSGPGHWPDADMLPIGRLGPAPGFGKARETRLTRDEQRTLLTLWSMFRSPLMLGGDLRAADEWTISLLTNPEVIAVDQHSSESRPVISTDTTVVWLSKSASGSWYYVAVFNISSTEGKLRFDWKQLDLSPGEHRVRDLWARKDVGAAKSLEVTLPSHGCALYSIAAENQ
jgi:alpha-galactosidase